VPALERPLVIVSDIHLGCGNADAVGRELAQLVAANPGTELVLAGDVFDLSFAQRLGESAQYLASILERAPELREALHRHVAMGATITALPGNHDAALGEGTVAAVFRERLELVSGAPVRISPWFVRRGPVHIEHGHVYDPDNAPIHPLSEWSDRSEPLGVALTRRFVAAAGASAFSHAQDATPVSALARAFRLYGARAPGMIAHYFRTAFELCVESGSAMAPHAERERGVGRRRLDEFAESVEIAPGTLAALVDAAPTPTHLCRRDMFLRLYFDRVFATLLFVSGGAAMPFFPAASVISLASLAYLAGSVLRGKDRYGALPRRRLADGAARVRELTDARVVVLGHTHHSEAADGYLNTGSFAFPRETGRPYVAVDASGAVALRRQGGN
jgi:predicted phosphodiesterase